MKSRYIIYIMLLYILYYIYYIILLYIIISYYILIIKYYLILKARNKPTAHQDLTKTKLVFGTDISLFFYIQKPFFLARNFIRSSPSLPALRLITKNLLRH